MFIWVFSLFTSLNFYWTKRNLCVTWRYFSKMWESTLQLIGTKQFSVVVIAQIIYLVGRCTAPWCCNQEVAVTSRPKAPSCNRLMSCCKNVHWPLGLKKPDSCTKCWTKTNGQRYRELQLIWHLVSWLSDAYDWRKHCGIPFKKNPPKCLCENPIVLWSNVLHWKVL